MPYNYNDPTMNPNLSSEAQTAYSAGKSDFWSGLENLFTGNKSYERELAKIEFQNAFNASEASKNRSWQEYMSNTAYQRAVEDMRKAGLNPYLAYQQGGSSTPSGATASAGSGGSTASASGKLANLLTTAFKVAAMVGSRMALAHSLQGVEKGVESATAMSYVNGKPTFYDKRPIYDAFMTGNFSDDDKRIINEIARERRKEEYRKMFR